MADNDVTVIMSSETAAEVVDALNRVDSGDVIQEEDYDILATLRDTLAPVSRHGVQ